ncbi:MAG: glycosyltransferase [Clostridia bacterium]|nr:glycosyltransferase [Clostridia bacterium]
MNELVSVVVPVYNVEKYLNRCISSIANQTYKNLEIILVDDGSPDNCPQICDEWAAKDIRVKVIHKKNQGLGLARNTGIDNATGDYICFFDSDDSIEPDTIETCVNIALEHNAELVVFGHDDVTPDMKLLGTHIPCPKKNLFTADEVKEVLLPYSLYSNLETGEDWNIVMSAWNKLYSMNIIKKSGWRFASEREIISEDFYSLTELYGYLGSVYILDKAFYHYTVNNASLSRSYRPDRFERIKVFYDVMNSLSKRMGLCDVLDQSIKGVTFGLIIGTMKIIVASELSFKQRCSELRKIVKDNFLQNLVSETEYSGAGWQKKLLYKATKNKLVLLCFLLVYLKNKCDA